MIDAEAALLQEKIEADIIQTLKGYYDQWQSPIAYKGLFTRHAARARKLGIGLNDLADSMVSKGLIYQVYTVNGARFFMPVEIAQELGQDGISEKMIGVGGT